MKLSEITTEESLLQLYKEQNIRQQKMYGSKELAAILSPELRKFAAMATGYYHDVLHPQDGDINEQFRNATVDTIKVGFATLDGNTQAERLELATA